MNVTTQLIELFTDALVGFGPDDHGLTEEQCFNVLIDVTNGHTGALEVVRGRMTALLRKEKEDDTGGDRK